MRTLALRLKAHASRAPNAREILSALIEHGHLDGFTRDGAALLSWRVPADLYDALIAFEADAPEDDECDEASAPFFGSGCAA